MTSKSFVIAAVAGAAFLALGCGGSPSTGKVARSRSALASNAVCTTYTRVAGPVTINTTADDTYNLRCIQVAPGTTVTIEGTARHPLDALDLDDGADTNPFAGLLGVGWVVPQTRTLTDAGIYGYYCQNHGDPDTGAGMTGAIQVVAPL